CVHQGDDPIDAALRSQVAISQERLYGRAWRGQTGSLDQQAVKRPHLSPLTATGEQRMYRGHEVLSDRATEAAVAELDHILFDPYDQTTIDAHLTKFIHNHRNALVMLR